MNRNEARERIRTGETLYERMRPDLTRADHHRLAVNTIASDAVDLLIDLSRYTRNSEQRAALKEAREACERLLDLMRADAIRGQR